MPRPLRVCIIGGGVGGLVLGQLLRENPDFNTTIYERDPAERPESSLAGFRILVGPSLLQSLRVKLPKDTVEHFEDAIGLQPIHGHSLFLTDGQAKPLMSVRTEEYANTCSVSRWKLRKSLLHGLDSSIRFNKVFQSYTVQDDLTVLVRFEDGETVLTDLLVGADGASSRVRRQLIPNTHRSNTGVRVIYWKMPCTPETEAMVPFEGTGCMAVPPRNSFIVSMYKNRSHPYGTYDLSYIAPGDSFLMCGLGCPTEDFINKTKRPEDMTPDELKVECLERARNWHPTFRKLVSLAIPSSVYMAQIRTQDPFEPWANGGRVTLLGDAAHSMTPYLGKGATSAMSDALLLAEKLQWSMEQDNGGQLDQALKEYEKRMLADGFKLSRASMRVHRIVYSWGSNRWKATCRDSLLSAVNWVMHLNRGQLWRWIGVFLSLSLLGTVTRVVIRVPEDSYISL